MTNPVEAAKQEANALLDAAYKKASSLGLLPPDAQLTGIVEIPRDSKNGDFAATHAMQAAKALKLPPRTIADALVDNIELDGTYFSSVNVAGAGFLNFTLSDKWYRATVAAVENGGDTYGAVNFGENRRVMVEFVSANPTGPMTIGNARGGALGDTLSNVLARAGYDVWREFYVNDTGSQVDLFGRSINARYMQLILGEGAVEFPDNGYHGDDIRDLAQLLYDEHGDKLTAMPEPERLRYFVEFAVPRNVALMREHLERYRIKYDRWYPETSLHESGYVAETVDMLTQNGLTYEKDGALWLRNTDFGADKDEVLRRSDGFFAYYAADIAYHRDKFARGFDRVINVLGADHHGHIVRFQATVKGAARILGFEPEQLTFLMMQMVRLTRDGETIKVSKRTGKALTLNDLLDEIPVDACRFFFNAKPDNHLEFDLGLAVRQDSENPVYYVQYAHARICSLIAALNAEGHNVPDASSIDMSRLNGEIERDLIKHLAQLPEEIAAAARELDPSRVNRYVVELASRFHKFYTECRIRGEDEPVLLARLKLADLTRRVIANCLGLIGVSAPDKM